MLAMTFSGPHGGHHGGGGHGHGGHGGHGHHGGGFRRRGGGGWWPGYYNYGPEVVVLPPTQDCQFTIQMPSGEQIIVTGTCPIALTGPVRATIAPR